MTNAIEKLNDIIELKELNDHVDDPDVERAMLKLASILGNPEINTAKIARHIIECDALATLFALKAKYYMTIGKDQPDARDKKNLYMTLREEFHLLANSLKIMVRTQL